MTTMEEEPKKRGRPKLMNPESMDEIIADEPTIEEELESLQSRMQELEDMKKARESIKALPDRVASLEEWKKDVEAAISELQVYIKQLVAKK